MNKHKCNSWDKVRKFATIETLEKDYYTKEEVDELINNLRNELQGDDDVTTE